jgi:hypothetical protein
MSTVTVALDPHHMLIVYASDVTEEERVSLRSHKHRPHPKVALTKFSYRELQAALVGETQLRPPPNNANDAARLNVGGRPPAATAAAAAAAAWPVWRAGQIVPFR